MRTDLQVVRVILGGADRRLNNKVEAAVLDVCFEQADVEFKRFGRFSEFARQAAFGADLVVLAPDYFAAEATKRQANVLLEEVFRLIREVKSRHGCPVIIIGLDNGERLPLVEAGADVSLGPFFNPDSLRAEVRRLLAIPEREEVHEEPEKLFFSFLLKGFKRNNA